MFRKAIEERQ